MHNPELNKSFINYYSNKVDRLREIFGAQEIVLENQRLVVDGLVYPIIDDVIILLDPSQYPLIVRKSLNTLSNLSTTDSPDFAEDIQFSFGEEWTKYPAILPEHKQEFALYFDLVNTDD